MTQLLAVGEFGDAIELVKAYGPFFVAVIFFLGAIGNAKTGYRSALMYSKTNSVKSSFRSCVTARQSFLRTRQSWNDWKNSSTDK
jgi:hypothetical protein